MWHYVLAIFIITWLKQNRSNDQIHVWRAKYFISVASGWQEEWSCLRIAIDRKKINEILTPLKSFQSWTKHISGIWSLFFSHMITKAMRPLVAFSSVCPQQLRDHKKTSIISFGLLLSIHCVGTITDVLSPGVACMCPWECNDLFYFMIYFIIILF